MPGFELIGKEERDAVNEVFDKSGVLSRDSFDALRNNVYKVREFEEAFAGKFKVKHAHAVTSGTVALHTALKALGIKPGDEVITQCFTFVATVEAIIETGAKPVLTEVDETLNMDTSNLETKITKKTKAIIPVHMLGAPAPMDEIMSISGRYNIPILEDSAQALGAEYRGKKVGSIGDAGCFSFFPAKNLGAFGDGGMVVTNDPELAEAVGMLRKHGAKASYYHLLPGFNSRLDTLQAAILSVKLKHLDGWNKLRREKASLYTRLLCQIDGIKPPSIQDGKPSFNYYTIRLAGAHLNRDELRKHLEARGIQTTVYYPLSLHLQPVYKPLGYKLGSFPESELAQEQVLSLPLYPELADGDIERIAEEIKDFCHRAESSSIDVSSSPLSKVG